MHPELVKAATRFPLDSELLYKGRAIGVVIGYKRANGTGSVEVIFQHYAHLASGKQGMFSLRSHSYRVSLAIPVE